jgi:hypothetical protein
MTKIYITPTQIIRPTLLALCLFAAAVVSGQTSYSITSSQNTSSQNWSAVLPSSCANCTITISSGMTLTIDESVTCQNCTIQGGNISINNQTLNIQYSGNSPVTATFSNVNLQVYGNNGKVVVNAPLSLTSSSFTFHDGSYFNTSYQVDLVSSTINLYDAASMYSTGSSSTTINLSSNSNIIIGTGSKTSTSSFIVSGPTINLYDNSGIALENNNNVYSNWANYYASHAHSTNASTHAYSTLNSTLNCGGSGQNSCANPLVYGPSTLSTGGLVSGTPLPVVLSGFAAVLNSDGSAGLSWKTEQEENSSRFEIERSADGAAWSTIGTVQAKGNSSSVSSYSYTDINTIQGTNYYRLKMIDLDGSAVYSDVKAVQTVAASHISFYPNPARDFVNVSLSGMSTATVRIINQAGAVMQEKKVQGGGTATFSLQQLSTGLYILTVTSENGVQQSSKLLVNKM